MQIKQFINNPFQENTYVVWDEQSLEAAIIDCGAMTDNERHAIECFVENHQLKVAHIINTHMHLDHCFGVAWCCAKYNLEPEASAKEESLFRSLGQQAALFGIPPSSLDAGNARLSIIPIDERTTISLGAHEIKVLETLGHTPGGICLYLAEDALLFSGDTLFNGSVGRSDLDGGSHSQLINSIKTKLATLPDNVTVYCGHGPYTTIKDEKQYNPFL